MTCCVTITRAVPNKETDTYAPSPISKLFSALIGKLAVAIEAERDIETINPRHPSCDRWITESEAAWSDVTNLHLALAQEPLLCAEDKPLRMLASLINRRCGVESADARLRKRHDLLLEKSVIGRFRRRSGQGLSRRVEGPKKRNQQPAKSGISFFSLLAPQGNPAQVSCGFQVLER